MNDNEQNNPAYYAIITAEVRYDKRLTPNAKLLFAEITALANQKGFCWSNNSYFAELYGVSKTSVSKWISQLVDCGYLENKIIYKKGSKEILHRYLSLVKGGMQEKLNTPIEEKLKDNTTSNNTTINNKGEREEIFKKQVFEHTQYSTTILNSFFDYWTESNPNGKKMKFEMNKTFDISKRLSTWLKNEKKWQKEKGFAKKEKVIYKNR